MSQYTTEIWALQTEGTANDVGEVAKRELTRAIRDVGGDIGEKRQTSRIIQLRMATDDLAPEAYRIGSQASNGRLVITCTGRDRRGLIYAAYDLADRIRHGEPIEGLEVTEEPHCTYRHIASCCCDHEFYARLIRAMPRWRMNALMLYGGYHQPHGLGGPSPNFFGTYLAPPIAYANYPEVNAMVEASPDFQYSRESFGRLLKLGKEYGVDVSLKFQVLSYTRIDASGGDYSLSDRAMNYQHTREDFPHLFPEGKDTPDWDAPAVYDFIRGQLEELFTMYPDLGGVMVSSDEMSIFNIAHAASGVTLQQRRAWMERLVETVEELCARYGKHCFWVLHGSGFSFLEMLLDIAGRRPGGLRLLAESTPIEQVFSDRFPSYPFDKVAAAGDGMCEHDISMEMQQDFPWLPNIIDRYIVRHVSAGLRAGLRGGGAMWFIYRPHYTPINSLSAINMELLSRLLWNPHESIDGIWERWLRRRFGRGAVVAGRLLGSTHDVLNHMMYFNNTNAMYWFQQLGFPGDLHGLMNPVWYQLAEYFQPEGTPLYANPWSAACKERAISMRQMRKEKQQAVEQSEELLAYLTGHESDLEQCDYRILLPRYVALVYVARAMHQLVEALYCFTHLYIRAYDPDCSRPQHGFNEAMAGLEQIHAEMLEDDRLLLFEPEVYYRGLKSHFMDNIPTLVADLRFHDQVLSNPERALNAWSGSALERAQLILANARQIREKFERNARGEVEAEEEWAKVLGDR